MNNIILTLCRGIEGFKDGSFKYGPFKYGSQWDGYAWE